MTQTTMHAPTDRLAALLDPTTVTVVGASQNAAPARHLMSNLLGETRPFRGTVNLVNRSRPRLYGRETYGSTTEVPGDPGLVFLLIAPEHCVEALRGFATLPTGVVVYASGAESGFGEVQDDLRAWSLETGVALLGPQATGIARPELDLAAVTAPLRSEPVDGTLGVVMQSAGLLGGTLNALWQRGIGVHTAVSLGNSAVINYADVSRHLVAQDDVRALLTYIDGVPSIEDLIDVAVLAQDHEKPLVLCVGGASEAGSAAAASHTGALATPRKVIEGIAEQYGVVLVDDTDELVWAADAFTQMDFRRPPAGGVGIFSTSGGGAIMVADAMSAIGAPLPEPGATTREKLSRKQQVVSFNPFDVGAAALDDAAELAEAQRVFAADPAFAVIVSVATVGVPTAAGMEAYVRQTTDLVENVVRAGKQPLIAAPVSPGPSTAAALHTWDGVVVGQGSKESAVKARSICAWAQRVDTSPTGVSLPDQVWRESSAPESVAVLSGIPAQVALSALPLSWPASRTVETAEDAADAFAALSLPLVAKVEAGLAHRAANGGVVRGLSDRGIAQLAVSYLLARFEAPVALVEQISYDSELTLGYQRDPRLGPLLMFGLGGGDVGEHVSFRRLPVSPGQVESLVDRYVLEPADRAALVRLVHAFSDYVLARPEIESLDLNPIVVVDGVVWALDAKIHQAP